MSHWVVLCEAAGFDMTNMDEIDVYKRQILSYGVTTATSSLAQVVQGGARLIW